MNIGSKSKKRMVLPSRPEPPTVDQILEDLDRAAPDDPIFSILEKTGQGDSTETEVELRFQQCRRYLELNKELQEARDRLVQQREELKAAGEQADREVEEIKSQQL
uniref:Si:ch73-238c9.1 n=1 Tax=Oreochromis niloticus TaxID=8128 RepID=I3JK31_ORENI